MIYKFLKMTRWFYILFLASMLLNISQAQDYYFSNKIGEFEEASAFDINASGFIVVADKFKNEIIKIDTNGNQIVTIGGYGWDAASFDFPADVFSNALSVYVCDFNNHRVQRFDKDLNFISQLNTRESENSEERFGYPVSCVTSNIGDLFILDSENKRIIKFDLFGNFIQQFGGYDAGKFSLNSPRKFAVTPNNNLFVIDENRIVIFDQYGNGISIIPLELYFTSIKTIYSLLTLNNTDSIYIINFKENFHELQKVNLLGYEFNENIVSSLMFNNKLYVLTQKDILVFIP